MINSVIANADADYGRDFHNLADHMIELNKIHQLAFHLMLHQTFSNLIVFLMISHTKNAYNICIN